MRNRAVSSSIVRPSPAKRTRTPISAKRLRVGAAERLGQQRVVAVLGVGVQRQVVGGERDVVGEERLQPAVQDRRDLLRIAAPEEAVVDQDEVGAGGHRGIQQ